MLERIQSEIRQVGRFRMAKHAEDTTFLVEAVKLAFIFGDFDAEFFRRAWSNAWKKDLGILAGLAFIH